MKICKSFFGAVVVFGLAASGQDEIFKDWNKPDSPGAAVAVVRDGRVVFSKGYGSANLEYGIPITPDTVFHVASVTKQFTAMALVLLEQDGKLSLEDDIRKYLPELPDYGSTVTIRHLLQHTGGIRDQWQTLGLAGWRIDDVITQKQILGIMFRQKELNFPPGTQHLYSNGGYTLAAEIAARVSGKTFPQFCEERIFKPLGMTKTHMHDDHRRVVRDRAYSYSRAAGGWEASPLNYANAGATSLFTTAPDLTRWLDNFREPKVGGARGVARLQEQAVLAGGTRIEYALGVTVGAAGKFKVISHAGGDAGYRSFVAYLPEQRMGVAVLSNAGEFNPRSAALRVAEAVGGFKFDEEPRPAPAKTAAPKPEAFRTEEMPQYPGRYWSDELEALYTVAERDGKLFANHVRHGEIALTPAGRDFFRSNMWFMPQVRFTRDPGGHIDGMTLGGGRVTAIRLRKQ